MTYPSSTLYPGASVYPSFYGWPVITETSWSMTAGSHWPASTDNRWELTHA